MRRHNLPMALAMALTFGSVALVVPTGDALAEEGSLYLGERNHVKLALGVGLAGREESDLLSLQPTLELRFVVGPAFGIQVVGIGLLIPTAGESAVAVTIQALGRGSSMQAASP